MEASSHVTSSRRLRRQQERMMQTRNNQDNMNDIEPSLGEVQNRRQKQKKPLNFYQAMSDFKTMFPHIDKEVIEAVLRANDGVVQNTIDQLLVLSETTANEDVTEGPRLPKYDECRRSEFVDEPPPAYSEYENNGSNDNSVHNQNSNATVNLSITSQGNSLLSGRENRLRFWNPPMIGRLPEDFLRLNSDTSTQPPIQNSATSCSNIEGFLTDSELEQYLEDQKLAMFLQNEEFIRQLRHDPDFITSLEEDHKKFMQSQLDLTYTASPSSRRSPKNSEPEEAPANRGGARLRSSHAHTDDAAFRNKLRHMGHSTRKKLGKMAKRFSRKKHHKLGTQGPLYGASTTNLLEDSDDEESNETGLEGIQEYEIENTDVPENNQHDEIKEKAGRKLPTVPASNRAGNEEPIVFYSEDNEFDYKLD